MAARDDAVCLHACLARLSSEVLAGVLAHLGKCELFVLRRLLVLAGHARNHRLHAALRHCLGCADRVERFLASLRLAEALLAANPSAAIFGGSATWIRMHLRQAGKWQPTECENGYFGPLELSSCCVASATLGDAALYLLPSGWAPTDIDVAVSDVSKPVALPAEWAAAGVERAEHSVVTNAVYPSGVTVVTYRVPGALPIQIIRATGLVDMRGPRDPVETIVEPTAWIEDTYARHEAQSPPAFERRAREFHQARFLSHRAARDARLHPVPQQISTLLHAIDIVPARHAITLESAGPARTWTIHTVAQNNDLPPTGSCYDMMFEHAPYTLEEAAGYGSKFYKARITSATRAAKWLTRMAMHGLCAKWPTIWPPVEGSR